MAFGGCLGGLTFPIGLFGVNANKGLLNSLLGEDEQKMLRLVESSGGLLGPSGFLLANGGFLHGIMMGLCALANSRQVLLGYLVLVILELAARNAVFACLFFWRGSVVHSVRRFVVRQLGGCGHEWVDSCSHHLRDRVEGGG